MVPNTLAAATSPIVDKALETGARGSTITKTDYGVIGDAMFKKAQLDLNIANLHADFGVQSAQIKGDLAMKQAGLELDKANILLDHDVAMQNLAWEKKKYKEENKVSDIEKIMGTVTGAAQGALGGFSVGGPPGAIVGAVIGGGATYAGYQGGGRSGGIAAQEAVGTLADVAGKVKGYNEQQKAKDSWESYLKYGENILSGMNTNDIQQNMQAKAKWQQHLNSGMKVLTDMGMNPQQAATAISSYDKSLTGGIMSATTDPADPQIEAGMRMQKRAVEAQAKIAGGKFTPKDLIQFNDQQAIDYAMYTGGKEMTANQQRQMAGSIGAGDMLSKMETSQGPNAKQKQELPATQRPQPQRTYKVGDSLVEEKGTTTPLKAKKKASTNSQAVAPSTAAPTRDVSGKPWHIPKYIGKGVEMDAEDAATNMVNEAFNLTKTGQASVETLSRTKEIDEGTGKKVSLLDKLTPGGSKPKESENVKNWRSGGKAEPIDKEVERMSDAEALDVELPRGADEKKLKAITKRKTRAIQEYTNEKMEGFDTGGKQGPDKQQQAIHNSAENMARFGEVLDSIPDGKVKRFLMKAEEEDADAVLSALGEANGGVIGDTAGVIGKTGKGISQSLKKAIINARFSDEEKDAIVDILQLRNDLRGDLLDANAPTSQQVSVQLQTEYEKMLPKLSDEPRARWRKLHNLANSLKGTIDSAVESNKSTREASRKKQEGNDLIIANRRLENKKKRRELEKMDEEEDDEDNSLNIKAGWQ